MSASIRVEDIDLAPSPTRAWLYLVGLCVRRHAQVRQMVWIALGLLAFTALLVGLFTIQGGWSMKRFRWITTREIRLNQRAVNIDKRGRLVDASGKPIQPQLLISNYEQAATALHALPAVTTVLAPERHQAAALQWLVAGTVAELLENSGLYVFSIWLVFSIFLSFLLPIWCLSFATEALGGEREARSLVWLLTRPLPRPMIYLAKYFGLLPWALGLNLGGFALLCLLAGPPGRLAFSLYWPAVLLGTLAFCSLFHLLGACFRRAAVVALLYSFFLETILGNMPGLMKRVSIGFYVRCLMFDAARDYGVQVDRPSVYLPVSGATAALVLIGVTVGLLLAGMIVFAYREYQELT